MPPQTTRSSLPAAIGEARLKAGSVGPGCRCAKTETRYQSPEQRYSELAQAPRRGWKPISSGFDVPERTRNVSLNVCTYPGHWRRTFKWPWSSSRILGRVDNADPTGYLAADPLAVNVNGVGLKRRRGRSKSLAADPEGTRAWTIVRSGQESFLCRQLRRLP
jgi:hypothetical protein